jgi:N-glycosylase/DNA lyase
MARFELEIETPADFGFEATVRSHGWYDLPPFSWNAELRTLDYALGVEDRAVDLTVRERNDDRLSSRRAPKKTQTGRLIVEVEGSIGRSSTARRRLETRVRDAVATMFNLHLDVGEFHRRFADSFSWAKRIGAGRMLRSADVFEDAMKTLATTNCSWALTKMMVTRIVDLAGRRTPSGKRSFPSPRDFHAAQVDEATFRETVRAGYRSPFFAKLIDGVVDGSVDLSRWTDRSATFDETVEQIRRSPGFGRYAAENLCRLFGRYEGLGVDSWCLKRFVENHGPVRGDVEKKLRSHFDRFGEWRGLAMWLDFTREWHSGAMPF